MRLLSRIFDALAMFALLALLGLTVLVLTSALAGRGFPFTSNFTSSDQPLSFDRLVIRAADQGGAAERAGPSRPSPVPTATADPGSAPVVTTEETHTSAPTASPTPASTAMPVAPLAPDGTAGSGDRAQSIGNGSTLASLPAVETSTMTKGATTITWESSFADFDYTLGDMVSLGVNWTVDSGAASYHGFVLKDYSPTSDKDPATGTTPTVVYPGSEGANSVDLSFEFTGLHLDKKRNIKVGTGHFKLYLTVDANGDGVPETLAGYGVNVHAEDPQM